MQFSYEVSEIKAIHHRLGAAKGSQARLGLTCKKGVRRLGAKAKPLGLRQGHNTVALEEEKPAVD